MIVMVMIMVVVMVVMIVRHGQDQNTYPIHQKSDYRHDNGLIKGNVNRSYNPLYAFNNHTRRKQGQKHRACKTGKGIDFANSEAVPGVCRKAPCIGVGKDGYAQGGCM
jgi:hypothetical protein